MELHELYEKLKPFLATGHQGTMKVLWVPDIEKENKKIDSKSTLLKACGHMPYYLKRLSFDQFLEHCKDTYRSRFDRKKLEAMLS